MKLDRRWYWCHSRGNHDTNTNTERSVYELDRRWYECHSRGDYDWTTTRQRTVS